MRARRTVGPTNSSGYQQRLIFFIQAPQSAALGAPWLWHTRPHFMPSARHFVGPGSFENLAVGFDISRAG